jgi:hypothetical protein
MAWFTQIELMYADYEFFAARTAHAKKTYEVGLSMVIKVDVASQAILR